MADIESTPPRKKRQRRPPLVGETKLFDSDPEMIGGDGLHINSCGAHRPPRVRATTYWTRLPHT